MGPTPSLEEVLTLAGLKISSLISGFSGAMMSLLFNKKLTFFQSLSIIASGLVCSGYITPGIATHWQLQGSTENMIAFILGLLGMYIVMAVIKFGEELKKDPFQTVKNLITLRWSFLNSKADGGNDKPSV